MRAKANVWRRHIRRSVRLGGDLDTVLADEMRLDVVIDNLLDNAAKYSPPDSPITVRGKHWY